LLIGSGKAERDGVIVAVMDSGPGLASADLERLFDAFYPTEPGGLGMGLSICRSIIEAPWGTIVGGGERTAGCRLSVLDAGSTIARPRSFDSRMRISDYHPAADI
jgi:C4-dicarboxylate-specific signal transduction histidine kinase